MVAFGECSETSAELALYRGGSSQESVPVVVEDVAEVAGHRYAIDEFPINCGSLQGGDGVPRSMVLKINFRRLVKNKSPEEEIKPF